MDGGKGEEMGGRKSDLGENGEIMKGDDGRGWIGEEPERAIGRELFDR
jgi:hypothetical protein